MRGLSAVVLTVVLVAVAAEGQAPPAAPSRPAFEVASVRPNTSGSGSMRIGTQPGGRFDAVNIPLTQLIQNAYQVRDFQIFGGPAWLSDRFVVVAKAETEFPPTLPGAAGLIGEVAHQHVELRRAPRCLQRYRSNSA